MSRMSLRGPTGAVAIRFLRKKETDSHATTFRLREKCALARNDNAFCNAPISKTVYPFSSQRMWSSASALTPSKSTWGW